MKSSPILEAALKTIYERGNFALEQASREIIQSHLDEGMISSALQYYAKTTLPRVFPIFPALLSLTCEMVGGKPERVTPLASSMMLMTASGDIHDDIIDKSEEKYGKKTLFGKYGSDIALLAGDALLMQGITLFHKRSEYLSYDERTRIGDLITQALFEIAKSEALETCLWKKKDVTPQEYFEVIRSKGVVAQLQCRIGAIIGGASEKQLKFVSSYGWLIGILSTVKDEFDDVLEFSELSHRIKYEIYPYPVLCAAQNESVKEQIIAITGKADLSKKDFRLLGEIVFNSKEVQNLKSVLKGACEKELSTNVLLKSKKAGDEAAILLQALSDL